MKKPYNFYYTNGTYQIFDLTEDDVKTLSVLGQSAEPPRYLILSFGAVSTDGLQFAVECRENPKEEKIVDSAVPSEYEDDVFVYMKQSQEGLEVDYKDDDGKPV